MARKARSTARLRWNLAASPNSLSPMERLVMWLERNGTEYRHSRRKTQMLGQFNEELETQGFHSTTTSAISSQILRLTRAVKAKAEGGTSTVRDIDRYYDRLLFLLFNEQERIEMNRRAAERVQSESQDSRSTKPRDKAKAATEKAKSSRQGAQKAGPKRSKSTDETKELNVGEIQRRYELVTARHKLLGQGIDQKEIDELFPLPKG